MKKILLAALFMGFIGALSAQKVFNDPNAEVRNVGSFHAIQVSHAFEVFLTQGNEEGVAVSSNDKEILSHIQTRVENGDLHIWLDDKLSWTRHMGNKKLRAYISVKDLDRLKASGACLIRIEGTLAARSLDVELSGATDLKGALNVSGDFNVHLSGASDLNITGIARNADFDISGASNIKNYDFTTASLKVEASGASDVHITVEKELSAKLSGASSLSYKGAASVKDVQTSGASSISRKS